ncbi:hypothetical protein GCM10027298_05740 [Epidermidibacterium keratini]
MLVDLAMQSLANRGLQPAYAGQDEIRVGDHRIFLDNLRAQLREVPQQQWPAEIDTFLGPLLAMPQGGSTETLADVSSIIYPRLTGLSAFGDNQDVIEKAIAAGRRVSDELVILPAIDRPETVETVTDPGQYGGWDAIWPVAMNNLRALPPQHYDQFAPPDNPAAAIHVLEGEDFFGASRVLVLEDALAKAGARLDLRNGALIAMPGRSGLAIHPVLDSEGVVTAMTTLIGFANGDMVGTVSTNVYFRAPDGTLQQVSFADNGQAEVRVVGPFEDAMRAIGAVN